MTIGGMMGPAAGAADEGTPIPWKTGRKSLNLTVNVQRFARSSQASMSGQDAASRPLQASFPAGLPPGRTPGGGRVAR